MGGRGRGGGGEGRHLNWMGVCSYHLVCRSLGFSLYQVRAAQVALAKLSGNNECVNEWVYGLRSHGAPPPRLRLPIRLLYFGVKAGDNSS